MGFLPKVRTRELICDWPGLEPNEGSDPLVATVPARLTWEDLEWIPMFTFTDGGLSYPDAKALREAVAPFVLAWNCEKVNRDTGTVEPAPADGGPDVFLVVDQDILLWLGFTLKTMHLPSKADQKKDTKPSAATPPPSPAASSSSKGRPSRSRSNRKGSAAPSSSI
jgi:hypothetical protein